MWLLCSATIYHHTITIPNDLYSLSVVFFKGRASAYIESASKNNCCNWFLFKLEYEVQRPPQWKHHSNYVDSRLYVSYFFLCRLNFLYHLGGHSQTMWTGKGEGGSEKSTLLYNPYRVKWSTKGEGGGSKKSKKRSTWFNDVPFTPGWWSNQPQSPGPS